MQELMQKHYEQLARATISQLRRRGFEAEWFATAEEAKAAALRLLPEGCTVAWAALPPSGIWGSPRRFTPGTGR